MLRFAIIVLIALAAVTATACGGSGPTPAAETLERPEPVGDLPEGALLVSRNAGEETSTFYALSAAGGIREVGEAHYAVLSPDRDQVALVSARSAAGASGQDRTAGVRIVTADGREVFTARAPQVDNAGDTGYPSVVWSPDGAQLAYTLPDEGDPQLSEAYVVNADGSRQRRLTAGPALYGLIGWAPDGRVLVSEFGSEGTAPRLPVMGAKCEELPLPAGAAEIGFPQPSPDGRYLAVYGGSWEEGLELWLVDVQSGGLRLIADMGREVRRPAAGLYVSAGLPLGLPPAETSDPLLKGPPPIAWSPDSGRIAYYKGLTDDSGELLPSELHVVDVESGQDMTLASPANGWLAVWSPQGRYLATQASGLVRLFQSDGTVRDTRVPADRLLWTSEEELIAAHPAGISLIDPATGEARDVLTADGKPVSGAQLWEPVWSPSGRYLAFATSFLTGGIPRALYVMDTRDGRIAAILDQPRFSPAAWLSE